MNYRVVVSGLKEFRTELRRATGAAPREVTRALKVAGEEELEPHAVKLAPRRSGELAGSASIRVRGTKAMLVFKAPYAPGAEFGLRGKWKGFQKYGPRAKRFAFRALEERRQPIARAIHRELRDIVTAHGWYR